MRVQKMFAIPVVVIAMALAGATGTVASASAGAARIGALSGVSCPSTSHCWAVGHAGSKGGEILATANGGSSWTTQLEDSSTSFDSVACPTLSDCWATGSRKGAVIYATTNGGKKWASQKLPKGVGFFGSVSCPSSSDCFAAGSKDTSHGVVETVLATSNGGATWSLQTVPKVLDGMGEYAAVSCTSTKDCVFAGFGALTTTNGGAKWTFRKVPRDTLPFIAVSCASKDCVALGYSESAIPSNESADIVTTSNGGVSWAVAVKQVPSVTMLGGASCPSINVCVTVGQSYTETKGTYTFRGAIFATTKVGGTWKPQTAPAAIVDLADVSCASTSHCVAVGSEKSYSDGAVIATTNGGKTWNLQTA